MGNQLDIERADHWRNHGVIYATLIDNKDHEEQFIHSALKDDQDISNPIQTRQQ